MTVREFILYHTDGGIDKMNKYDFELDVESENSLSVIISMINRNSTILEFGPANGRLTRYLHENLGCIVDIVEIDSEAGIEAAKYSRNFLVGLEDGNIENFTWCQKLNENKYDYIIFADVLEHLHDPKEVLIRVKSLLNDDGVVLLSVPNIAHNAVLLNLLENKFPYRNVGLLDNTHIHFFAYHDLKEMIKECGYYCLEQKATYCKPENTEFHNSYDSIEKDMRRQLCNKKYGNVYQFVFKIADRTNEEVSTIAETECVDRNMDYELSCYLKEDENSDFSEVLCEKKFYKPGKNRFIFDFSKYKTIAQLRIDPMECNCVIKNLKIGEVEDKKELEIIHTNGLKTDDKYIFKTDDPMIIVEKPKEKKLAIEFEVLEFESSTVDALYDIEIMKMEYIKRVEKLKNDNQKAEKNIEALQLQDQENKQKIDELQLCGEENKKKIDELKMELCAKENKITQLEIQLSAILESECWKLTKPLRVILNKVEKNRYFDLIYRGIYSLKVNGAHETWNKIIRKYRKKFNKSNMPIVDEIDALNSSGKIQMEEIQEIKDLNKTIAVHLHLFYIDLLKEFFEYLNNIPFAFDLYVSCKSKTDIEKIEKTFKKLKNVKKITVLETINRGRDIAPFYVQFGNQLKEYDYLLHIHSKKSLFTGEEQYGWRRYSLDSLLGNADLIRKIFSLFESDKKIGLFFPETYGNMHIIAQDWLANKQLGKELLSMLRIPFDDGLFNYPVGSFFWVKAQAIKPIFDLKLKYEDFPEENGQTDGTLAHALERAISFVVKHEGYELAIHDLEGKSVFIGKSYKLFQEYFSLDSDAVQYHLSQYELVSFDIFDTLITREVLEPDDVFKIVENQIIKKYGFKIDFIRVRKMAEQLAWQKKGAWTNIYDIYDELSSICKEIDEKNLKQIMKLEIDIEIKLCVPRRDMLKIFNHVKKNKCKIILVSDMYLPSDVLSKMLEKCGYTGYDDIWVSCEKGTRKDDGSMWDLFFNIYGAFRTIHVGDNPRSDIQLVGDKKRDTFYVMNPCTAFKLSEIYPKFKKYMGTSIENSICLGLVINNGIYNSPFSLKKNGEPEFESEDQMGYISLGVLFSKFTEWIVEKKIDQSKLLFLAREGYFLQKIYKQFLSITSKEKGDDSVYFLTSRRAVSVAAIKSWDDVKEILEQFYRGKLSNLLYARLGYKWPEDLYDCEVEMPRDSNFVMEKIFPYKDSILKIAQEEKNTYMKYLKEICSHDEKLTVVDVGYSGTIQYYLMKLMNENIDGLYLCTLYNKKPEKIGGISNALYENNTEEQQQNSKIYQSQLFLEAVLKAPYGQLLYFKENDDKAIPVFKEGNEYNAAIENVQKGILRFAETYWNLMKTFKNKWKTDENLAEDLLYYSLKGEWMPKRMEEIFIVEDDYCSNGKLSFDKKGKKWRLI